MLHASVPQRFGIHLFFRYELLNLYLFNKNAENRFQIRSYITGKGKREKIVIPQNDIPII